MKYIIMVSYGDLAKSLKETALSIAGHKNHILSFCFQKGMTIEKFSNNIENTIKKIIFDDPIIILTDSVQGIPFKTSIKVLDTYNLLDNAIILGGMNLSMAVSAIIIKDDLEGDDLKNTILREALISMNV